MRRIALIDGDIVIYQAACKAETEIDWSDGDTVSITGSKPETRDSIDSMVRSLKRAVKADRVLLVFSDTENFRKSVYPNYKSNRKDKRKPVTFGYGKGYAKEHYDHMTREGLEADDCLAILATGEVAGFLADKVVCSIDKDMRTFPCKLYNWMKQDEGVVEVTEADANRAFYMQILTGDSVDGYPGCPGIGPKRAERLLTDANTMAEAWPIIVTAYQKAGLDEIDAVIQARCARILRASDYDFNTKKPILWNPPKEKAKKKGGKKRARKKKLSSGTPRRKARKRKAA